MGDIEFFEENSFRPSTEPVYDGKEWYIQGMFSVVDELTAEYNRKKPFYKRRKGNKGGDLGHMFPFLICSPGFAEKNETELRTDGYKPIIMANFNVDNATRLIAEKVRQAGDHITIDELWAYLSTFCDTDYDS